MKKIKETRLGIWLKEKAPDVLRVVGDVLPNNGVLGIVKNMLNDKQMTIEDMREFRRMEVELIVELSKLEQKDKESARTREVEYMKLTGHSDWMMIFVGVMIILCFFFLMIFIVYKPIPQGNEHIIINAVGILEGLILSIAGYYYGSSYGSRMKDLNR
jgi:hypothetical protein